MTKRTARAAAVTAVLLAALCLLWTVHSGAFSGSVVFGQAAERHDDDHDKDHKAPDKDADGHGKHDKDDDHATKGAATKPCEHCAKDKPGEHDKHATTQEACEHCKPGKPCEHCKEEKHGEHADEKHDEHGDEKHDEHGDEKKGGHEGHDDHEDEIVVRMTPAQRQRFGIVAAKAQAGKISKHIRLPGEININADRAAHVVPSTPGIVRKVIARMGDTVASGDVLAVIESAELAEAKSDYLTKLNELSCCSIDVTRARTIRENTVKLLALLAKSPSLDELTRTESAETGQNRAVLVSAYAELVYTRSVYEREKTLLAQKISSKNDFQTAEAAYKKAQATYAALRDSTSFATMKSLFEAQRSRRNQEFSVKAAERKLHVLGLGEHDMAPLRKAVSAGANTTAAAPSKKAGGHPECTDPNCKECKAEKPAAFTAGEETLGSKLGWYPLRAPFDGTVIARHMALGEKLTGEADVLTIADMSTVWVDLSVYQKDLRDVRKGQSVDIHIGSGVPDAVGKIAYVSPIVDDTTRTCLARIVLPNPKGLYRPGLFVTAKVDVGESNVDVLIPKSAVQRIENKSVVFVPTDEGLVAEPVKLGRSSRTHVEILSGLHAGEKYIARGAFKLKAKLVTSGLGAHAGHGH